MTSIIIRGKVLTPTTTMDRDLSLSVAALEYREGCANR